MSDESGGSGLVRRLTVVKNIGVAAAAAAAVKGVIYTYTVSYRGDYLSLGNYHCRNRSPAPRGQVRAVFVGAAAEASDS